MINIDKDQRTGGVLFDAGLTVAITFADAANQLSIRTGGANYGIVNNSSQTITFESKMAIEAAMTWAANAASGGLVFSSEVDTGGFNLTFDTSNASSFINVSGNIINAGGLTKTGSGTVTLTGVNTYTGGTTISAGILNLGNATNTLSNTGAVTVAGGTLALGSNSDTVGAVTLSSGTITGPGGTLTGSSYALTDTGSVSAVLAGSGALTKTGAGNATLTGANTYTGGTNVNAGTLTLGNATNTLSNTGAVTVAGGTLALGSNSDTVGAVTLSSGSISGPGTLTGSSYALTDTGNVSAVLAGAGALTKTGAGTAVLTGSNTYSGATTVSAGTLQLSGSGRLADTTAVTVNSPGTFDLNSVSDTVGSIAGSGNITLGSGTLTAGGNNSTTEFTGSISGTGSLNKAGTGTLTLNGDNSTLTSTTVNGGKLVVDGGGSNRLANSAQVTINDTGTFEIRGLNTLGTGDANVVDFTVNSGGTLGIVSGSNPSGNSHVHLGDLNLAGGTVDLSYSGGGSVFDGESAVLRGSVNVTADSSIQFGSGATNANAGIGLNNNNSFTVGSGVTLTVNAELEDGGPPGVDGFTKFGTGNMVLGNTNSYGGDTTVSAGTLTLSADGALGTGSTTVASGATLALTGGINVAQTGYTLAGTGDSSAGALQNLAGNNTLTGDFTLSGATTLESDAGTLTLGSTTLDGVGYYIDVLSLGSNGLTVNGAGDTQLYANLSGTGNLIKNDGGTLTVSGVIDERFDPRFTGEVIINDGELIQATFDNDAPTLGSPAYDDWGINGAITVGDGTGTAGSAKLTIGLNDADGTTFANVIGQNVDLTVNADGAFDTQGHTQYVQNITLDGGAITTEYNAGATEGTLFVTGSITSTSTTQIATIDGEINLNGDAAKVIDVATSSTLDIGARIVAGGFEKTGDGTLILGNVNTFAGAVDVSAGILRVDDNEALGGTSGLGTTNVDSGAQLQLNNVTIGTEALTLNGAGISSDGALHALSGTNSWAGSVTLASASEIHAASGANLTVSGTVTGSNLTIGGAGNTTLSGSNTYNTLTKEDAGTLTLSGGAKTLVTTNVTAGNLTLGTSNILADGMDLNVSGTGTFTMASDINETIDQLNVSSGTLDVDGILTMNGGTLSGGNGAGSTGELILTAGNTLNITNNFDFGGTLELTSGTTLALSGGHTFNLENLSVTGNTVIDFGTGSENTLNLGSLTIASGVTITVNNWASFQDLWTTGSFDGGFGSVTIDERDSNTAQITFTGFSPADTIWLTEDFGTNEITVPEPSSYGAILMGFGLAAWTLRRPRRPTTETRRA